MDKIQQLATTVSESLTKRGLRCKFWNKGEIYRLYLYSPSLYDTKKCRQTAYIDLKRFCVHVTTECPSQPDEWCVSQNMDAERWLEKWARYTRFVAHKLGITEEQKHEEHERIGEAGITVKGYWLEGKQERVPTNRFGKIATRNRQYIHVWEGCSDLAPHGFVALTDAEYEVAKTKAGTVIESYSTPKFS
jgi:hypothetical protein